MPTGLTTTLLFAALVCVLAGVATTAFVFIGISIAVEVAAFVMSGMLDGPAEGRPDDGLG